MKKVGKSKNSHIGLVICKDPEQYEIFDFRINKPICFQDKKDDETKGSMVFQEMDEVIFNKKKNIKIDYFTPNNIALSLTISAKASNEAQDIYNKHLDPYKTYNSKENKTDYLINKSKIFCDYLEKIQISIVFSYTALETFCNLSIPENYNYKFKDNKGITHSYDKDAIERWISLQEKISKILTNIYNTKTIKNEKFWNYFIRLEEFRNNIIHQKSIERTDFFKAYFRPYIFKICKSSIDVIKFFHKKQSEKNKPNPLWPWLINPKKEFPLADFKSERFEIIGNLYEGTKKK